MQCTVHNAKSIVLTSQIHVLIEIRVQVNLKELQCFCSNVYHISHQAFLVNSGHQDISAFFEVKLCFEIIFTSAFILSLDFQIRALEPKYPELLKH